MFSIIIHNSVMFRVNSKTGEVHFLVGTEWYPTTEAQVKGK